MLAFFAGSIQSMGGKHGKRALVILLCAALLFCLVATPFGGSLHLAFPATVSALLPLPAVRHRICAAPGTEIQPLSFLALAGCRAPPFRTV